MQQAIPGQEDFFSLSGETLWHWLVGSRWQEEALGDHSALGRPQSCRIKGRKAPAATANARKTTDRFMC
jgi:hypothetical protein